MKLSRKANTILVYLKSDYVAVRKIADREYEPSPLARILFSLNLNSDNSATRRMAPYMMTFLDSL
jgi:hypothetical protein